MLSLLLLSHFDSESLISYCGYLPPHALSFAKITGLTLDSDSSLNVICFFITGVVFFRSPSSFTYMFFSLPLPPFLFTPPLPVYNIYGLMGHGTWIQHGTWEQDLGFGIRIWGACFYFLFHFSSRKFRKSRRNVTLATN